MQVYNPNVLHLESIAIYHEWRKAKIGVMFGYFLLKEGHFCSVKVNFFQLRFVNMLILFIHTHICFVNF